VRHTDTTSCVLTYGHPLERMTYVEWHERPEHVTHATVSRPDDLKALAKPALEKQAESQEIEYPPDEHITNIRVAGVRRLL
jgi:hypothetical protein